MTTTDNNINNSIIVRIAIKLSNTLNYIVSIPTRMFVFAKHVLTRQSIKNDIIRLSSEIHTLQGVAEELRIEIGTIDENSPSKGDIYNIVDEKIDDINWSKRIDLSDLLSDHESDVCDIIRNNWDLDDVVDESKVYSMIEDSYSEDDFIKAVKKHSLQPAQVSDEQIKQVIYTVLSELINNIKSNDTTTNAIIRSDSNQ